MAPEQFSRYLATPQFYPWMEHAQSAMRKIYADYGLEFPLMVPMDTVPVSGVLALVEKRREPMAHVRGKFYDYVRTIEDAPPELVALAGIAVAVGTEFDAIAEAQLRIATHRPNEPKESWRDSAPAACARLDEKIEILLSDWSPYREYLSKNIPLAQSLFCIQNELLDASDVQQLAELSKKLEAYGMTSYESGYAMMLFAMCEWFTDPNKAPETAYAVLEPDGRPLFQLPVEIQERSNAVLDMLWDYGKELYQTVPAKRPPFYGGWGAPPMGNQLASHTAGEAFTREGIMGTINFFKSQKAIEGIFTAQGRGVPSYTRALQRMLYDAHELDHKCYIPNASHIAEILPDLSSLYRNVRLLQEHGGELKEQYICDFLTIFVAESIYQEDDASREYRLSSYCIINTLVNAGALSIDEMGIPTIHVDADVIAHILSDTKTLHQQIRTEDAANSDAPKATLSILKALKPSDDLIHLVARVYDVPKDDIRKRFQQIGDLP